MQPLISIIVPVYNIEPYLERCLKGICAQTYQNLQIIVVDDGSTDGSRKIIEKMQNSDSRVEGVFKKNGGVSSARNEGLKRVRGEYVGFVDGDDLIESDMYEFLYYNIKKYDADISHCGYQMVFPDRTYDYYGTERIVEQNHEKGLYDLISAEYVEPGVWNKLYKKEILLDLKFDQKIRINEDFLFNFYAFQKSQKSIYHDLMKYYYVVRRNSASTTANSIYHSKDVLVVIEEILKKTTGETARIAQQRYIYQLIQVCVSKQYGFLKENQIWQKEQRKKLKYNLSNKQVSIGKKVKILGVMAVYCPGGYRLLHEIYSKLSGNKDRYKV